MSNELTDNQVAILDAVKQGNINSFCELFIKIKSPKEFDAVLTKIILSACQFDRLEILKILIENNYSLLVQDEEGDTPCHTAVQFSKIRILKFIFKNKYYSFQLENKNKETLVALALKNADYATLECLKDEALIDENYLTDYLEKIVEHLILNSQGSTPAKPYRTSIKLLKLLGANCTDNAFKKSEKHPHILSYLYPDYLNELKDILEENKFFIHNILSYKLNVPKEFLYIDPVTRDKMSLLKWLQNEFETITGYYAKKDIYPVIREIQELLETTAETRERKEKYQTYAEIDPDDIKLQAQLRSLVKNLWQIHQVIKHKELNIPLYDVKLEIYASDRHYTYSTHFRQGTEYLYTDKTSQKIVSQPKIDPKFFGKRKEFEQKTDKDEDNTPKIPKISKPIVITIE